MALKIIKNILAISWISIVVFFYFKNHGYYTSNWEPMLKFLPYTLLIPVTYICYAAYRWSQKGETKIKIKLTFLRIFAAAFLLIFIAGNAAFIVKDPSHYQGDDIFYVPDEAGGYIEIISDLSTLTGNEVLILGHGGALEETEEAFEKWIDPYIQPDFELPTFWGKQLGLISKTLGILGALGLITVVAISLGHTIYKKALKEEKITPESGLISLVLGFFGISVLIFMLGALNVLTLWATWILFAAILAICWKSLIKIIKDLFRWEYIFETKIINFDLLIILALILFISINFIDNISPLPRGWDGMNQYINAAKRLSETEGLIQTGLTYSWELIISLGFVMFNWTTVALNLSGFFPGIIALVGLYIILRKFISKRASLIVVASIYLTPIFQFHGAEDNKVDLAHLFTGITAFLALYNGFTSESKREKISLIAIAGILAGFALGIKLTAMLLVVAFIAITLYKEFKAVGAIAGILITIAIPAIAKNINLGQELNISAEALQIVGVVLLIISILLILTYAIQQKKTKLLKTIVILGLFTGIGFSHWMIKNTIDGGSIIYSADSMPDIDYEMLEEDYSLDQSLCESTGIREELQRYMGYESIIKRYFTMPWHLTMDDQGTQGIYIDFGWIPLAFIPALLLFIPIKKPNNKWKLIMLFTVSYWLAWVLTCYGIIWYGFPGFLALGLITGVLIDNYEKGSKYHKYVISTAVVIFLITSLAFRLTMFGKGTLLLYTSNVMDEEEAVRSIFPYALDVGDIFRADQDGEYDLIWKVGTNLSYFIEDNFWRTYNDQYLDSFNCLYAERDPELLDERLRALGYGYIIFDYYTYSLSPDPENSLYQKYEAALEYILGHAEMVVNDYYRGHIVVKIPGT